MWKRGKNSEAVFIREASCVKREAKKTKSVKSEKAMEKFDIEKAKQQISNWVKQRDFIKEVYFFGLRISGKSHKTGNQFTEQSDLDVIFKIEIFKNDESIETTWDCESDVWEVELEKLLNISISLVLYEDAEKDGFLKLACLVYSRL